jgi:RNA recognition motif-containing protein
MLDGPFPAPRLCTRVVDSAPPTATARLTATAPLRVPFDHTRSTSRIKELMMATKSLYVGNLPYDITEQDLRNLFEAWGPVAETRLISARGFGFVEVPAEKAADAITAMNGKDFKGRALVVNEARPRTERPAYRDGGGGGGRDRPGGGGPPRGGRGGGGGRRDRGGDRGPRW